MLALRAVHISGLAEAATANTAAHQFEHGSVLRYADKRYQRIVDKIRAVQDGHDKAAHLNWCLRTERLKGRQRAVLMVFRFIKRRHVDTRQRRNFF